MKKLILPLLLSVFVLSGCSKDATDNGYIKLSDNSCSFNIEGGSTTVIVNASGSWSAENASEWITLSQQGNTLTITAEENTFGQERSAYILIIAGNTSANIDVYQVGDSSKPVIYRKTNSYICSPSVDYIGGITYPRIEAGSASATQYIILQDIRNDKVYQFGPYSSSLYSLEDIKAIDDKGDMYISNGNNGMYFFNSQDASIVPFDSGDIFKCSADGTVAVGASILVGADGIERSHFPIKWVNGVAHQLELPETPTRPQYPWGGGCIARSCSADGKIVMGTEWNNTDFFILWWDENNNVHRAAEDVYGLDPIEVTDKDGNTGIYYMVTGGMMTTNNPEALSRSGKWIAASFYRDVITDAGAIYREYYPGFYNTQENKTHIFWDYPDGSAQMARDSDNIGFIQTNARLLASTELEYREYYTVDIEAETVLSSTQDWFHEKYDIYPPSKSLIYYFSEDDRIALFQDAYVYDRR